ncbi:MAG: prepilin peptidase [Dehalococcoidales bacterium]|jgi:leader peptidase (prepilin peptidase)/N-methyltransferase|nr:prepilin peptidase [Dehalococcoidales bacterium]
MSIFYTIIFLLLGLAVGSFLNVCIDRLPENKSLLSPPSYCPACNKRLAVKDLAPVFSYIALKGRCRYCQNDISKRMLLVEMSTGIGFVLLYYFYGLSIELALVLFYFSLFLVIFFIDIERRLILNKIIYPGAITALIISIFLPYLNFAPAIAISEHFADLGWATGIVGSLLGGAVGFGIFVLIALVSRGGMGEGDVKMVGIIGLIVGFPLIFVAILMAIVIGGLVASFMIIARIKDRKQSIAFGPFLSIAAMATILWGNVILNWYMGMIL